MSIFIIQNFTGHSDRKYCQVLSEKILVSLKIENRVTVGTGQQEKGERDIIGFFKRKQFLYKIFIFVHLSPKKEIPLGVVSVTSLKPFPMSYKGKGERRRGKRRKMRQKSGGKRKKER